MACTITSLFLFAMLGVVVAGLAFRPSEKTTPPVRGPSDSSDIRPVRDHFGNPGLGEGLAVGPADPAADGWPNGRRVQLASLTSKRECSSSMVVTI